MLDLLASLIAAVPFGDLRALGRPIAWLAGAFLRIRRSHVEGALTRAGLPATEATGMYASLGAGVMELLWLAGRHRRLEAVAQVDPGSEPLLSRVLRSGGVVLAASHTGNWELAACALAERCKLSVLVKPVTMGIFEDFMKQMRKRYGVGRLTGEGALTEARALLESGGAVAVLIDQVPRRAENAEVVSFLGEDALADRTPAALAASVGCPLLMTASRRDEEGRHWLHVLSVKHPPRRARSEWVRRATRETSDELAAFVRAYPDQWLWLHRRWKRGDTMSSCPAPFVPASSGSSP
jgi:KDO2-lipid IV(A) lauroyltransferase